MFLHGNRASSAKPAWRLTQWQVPPGLVASGRLLSLWKGWCGKFGIAFTVNMVSMLMIRSPLLENQSIRRFTDMFWRWICICITCWGQKHRLVSLAAIGRRAPWVLLLNVLFIETHELCKNKVMCSELWFLIKSSLGADLGGFFKSWWWKVKTCRRHYKGDHLQVHRELSDGLCKPEDDNGWQVNSETKSSCELIPWFQKILWKFIGFSKNACTENLARWAQILGFRIVKLNFLGISVC